MWGLVIIGMVGAFAPGTGTNRQLALEVSLLAGAQLYRFGADEQGLTNGFAIEPRIGLRILRPLLLELGLPIAPTHTTGATRSAITVLSPHLDLDIDLANSGDGFFPIEVPALESTIRFFPYAGGGLGGVAFTGSRPQGQFASHLFAGLRAVIWGDLGLRAEVRGMWFAAQTPGSRYPGGVFGDLLITLGAFWTYGGVRPAAVTPPPASAPAAAPVTPPVEVIAVVKDTDGDGVPDDADSCPTIAGSAAFNGCPAPDRDGDGVPDDSDDCPTEAGRPERKGCPDNPVVKAEQDRLTIRESAHFELDSAVIAKDYLTALDAVAAFIGKHPEIEQIGVYGHSDNQARPQYNMSISQQRAESVVDYLVSRGVPRDHLLARGFGDTRPVASNKTAMGRNLNRRVEFVILKRGPASTTSSGQ